MEVIYNYSINAFFISIFLSVRTVYYEGSLLQKLGSVEEKLKKEKGKLRLWTSIPCPHRVKRVSKTHKNGKKGKKMKQLIDTYAQ